MLRIQGAHGAAYGGAPGRGLPDTGTLPANRARLPTTPQVPELAAGRPVSDVVGRVRADLRAARSGAVAQPWITPATVGVVLLLAFVWMVLQVVSAGPFVAWDWAAREWVYARRAQGGMATFLEVQAFVTGERWATVPVVMGAGALVAHRRGTLRPLYAVMAGLATIAAIGYPVKFGLGRSSPVTGVDLLFAGGQAFPSGHAANTAFTATMVVFLLFGSAGLRPDRRRFRRGVVVVVALLAVSGPLVAWMGYHWLSDIPAGWLMGFIALCVSLTVLHWPERAEAAVPDEARTGHEPPPAPSPVPRRTIVPGTGT
ncbi:phosphatase PAP2 family protein [Myceligenerans salitolerans]|uniref:Phosphatase PAP2 family protein n=1 Tax=Myceligenerans salitolerans TaxID=1230528 RepID=A0ABS3I921_9MICO|nr:phosphatase PAP2 family protein [Myceligenerans salitolerans]MBO0608923.1 phosphatase PAP2 family protein [Myceligenerans salitolerans]